MQPPEVAALPPKERRWPIALLVAVITGIAGFLAVIPVAEWGMEMHHVSSMEGGRGCMMVAIWMPLAALAGSVSGFAIGLLLPGSGFAGFLKRQLLSLALLAVLIACGAGVAYETANHPPLLNGKPLALEIEVQLPANGRSVPELQAADFHVALVVNADDRSYSDIRWVDAVASEGKIFVTAWAPMRSSEAGRTISVGTGSDASQYFAVRLPARPKKIDDEWSEWIGPGEQSAQREPKPEEESLVRYRVRYGDEYEPTPAPEEPDATVEPASTP